MTEPGRPDENPFPLYLFRITGRIRPAQFFIAIGVAFATLIATFVLVGAAMAPTGGGGGAVLAIPMFFLFLWMIVAAIVQRLRDAGRPVRWSVLFILGPVLLIFLGLELIEYAGVPIALAFIAILLTPGFLKLKTADELAVPK